MAKRSVIFVHGHSRGAYEEHEWLAQTVGDPESGRTGRLLEGFKLALRLVEAGEEVPLLVVGSGAAGEHRLPGKPGIAVPVPTPEEREVAGFNTLMEMLNHAGTPAIREAFDSIYAHPRFMDVVKAIQWDTKSDNTFKEAELVVKKAKEYGRKGDTFLTSDIDIYCVSNPEHGPRAGVHTLQYIWDEVLHDDMRKHDYYCKVPLHAMPGPDHVPTGNPAPIGMMAAEDPHQPGDPFYGHKRVANVAPVAFSGLAREAGYVEGLAAYPKRFAAEQAGRKIAKDAEAANEAGMSYDI